MQFLITIVSLFYILFLPGFVLSLVLFNWGRIDTVERLAFSIGLSIAIVPLVAFCGNLLGVPITATTVVLDVTGVVALTGIILLIQHGKATK